MRVIVDIPVTGTWAASVPCSRCGKKARFTVLSRDAARGAKTRYRRIALFLPFAAVVPFFFLAMAVLSARGGILAEPNLANNLKHLLAIGAVYWLAVSITAIICRQRSRTNELNLMIRQPGELYLDQLTPGPTTPRRHMIFDPATGEPWEDREPSPATPETGAPSESALVGPTVRIGCLSRVVSERMAGSTIERTTEYSVFEHSFRLPRTGQRVESIECPHCKLQLRFRVSSPFSLLDSEKGKIALGVFSAVAMTGLGVFEMSQGLALLGTGALLLSLVFSGVAIAIWRRPRGEWRAREPQTVGLLSSQSHRLL
jgi:hypothetical protein